MATTPLTKSQGPAKSRRPRSSASASGSGVSVKTCFTPRSRVADRDAAAARRPRRRRRSPRGPSRRASAAEGVGVADAGGGIDGGRLAAGDRARAPRSVALADPDVAADEVELGEGRQAVEPDVAAEALHRERPAEPLAERGEAGAVQDRDRGKVAVGHADARRATTKAGRARSGFDERRHPGDQPGGVRRVVGIDGERLAAAGGSGSPGPRPRRPRRGSPSAPATWRRG